jgi:hypothetical protein
MSDVDTVPMPEKAKESLRIMIAQRQQIEQQIQSYLKGIYDSLGLEGEDWTVEMPAMTFVRKAQSPNGYVEQEAEEYAAASLVSKAVA